MIDTSALIAGLVADHEHHHLARPALAAGLRVPALVLAEAYSQLRRTFGQPASAASAILSSWTSSADRILATGAHLPAGLRPSC